MKNKLNPLSSVKLPNTVWAIFFLAILCIAVWGKTIGYDFVWDDEYFIVSNQAIRSAAFLPRYFTDISTTSGEGDAYKFFVFRPLRNISYLIDFKLAGLNPGLWHLHNLFLHLINACLVFAILKALFKNLPFSVFGAALFLIHPVQSEVVAWVKCRDDLLSCFFILIAFFLWIKWRSQLFRMGRFTLFAILYLLACLSKEQAIVFPLALIVYEYWVGSQKDGVSIDTKNTTDANKENVFLAKAIKIAIYLFIVGFAYAIWRHLVLGQTEQRGYLAGSFLPTILTMTKAGVRYLLLLVYPNKLFADYSWIEPLRSFSDWRVWINGGFLIIFVTCLFVSRRRHPITSFGLVWVVIFLLPVSNIIPTMQYMAERFLYLPMAGFTISATALLLYIAKRRQKLALTIAIIILVACGIKSTSRASVWENNLSLFTATVRDVPPDTTRPLRNLLASLMNNAEYEKALPIAKRLLEKGREEKKLSKREEAEYLRHQGFILVKTGKPKTGSKLLQNAIEADPTYMKPYLDLGVLEGSAGNHEDALKWFHRAIEKDKTNNEAYYNMGVALRELGRKEEAEEAFKNGITYGNQSIEVYKALASILWSQGKTEEAISIYREAIQIHPDNSEIRNFLNKVK